MKQKALEIQLQRVPAHPSPDPNLEQYQTPAPIAADLLYRALAQGDIKDQRILDLGCGTGILMVGALLLGARTATGVDVDPFSVQLARQTLELFQVKGSIELAPIESFSGEGDTALMNPPFGAQFAQRHADSIFLQHALRLAPVCYSFHLKDTRRHVEKWAQHLNASFRKLTEYDFPLPHQFRFHTKEKVLVRVMLYRFQRMGTASPRT